MWATSRFKISHRDEAITSEFAIALANEFGPKTTISRAKVHNYTSPGTLIISMIRYLQKMIDGFPEMLRGTKACPFGDKYVQGTR